MPRILILYATTEGHTGRIAERIARSLRDKGCAVDLHAAETGSTCADCGAYDGVVIGASIHYGRHPRHLHTLVRTLRPTLAERASAFFSVSLSAGGPGAKPQAARRYLETFLRQTGWQPSQAATFAGALQYSKYGLVKRMVMIMFVGLAGGDTDSSRDYEYTDWDAVDRFTEKFTKMLEPT